MGARHMRELIVSSLEDDKAIDIEAIDLEGKTSIADYMVVASGTSQRHISAIAEKLMQRLKEHGIVTPGAEGLGECSWVLIDAGDVVVHIFRAETRALYDIERLWSVAPAERLRIVSSS